MRTDGRQGAAEVVKIILVLRGPPNDLGFLGTPPCPIATCNWRWARAGSPIPSTTAPLLITSPSSGPSTSSLSLLPHAGLFVVCLVCLSAPPFFLLGPSASIQSTLFFGGFLFLACIFVPLAFVSSRSLVASLCLGSSQQYVLPYLLLVAIHSNPCNISFTRRLCHQPFLNCPLFLSGVDFKPDQPLHTTRRLETCCFTYGSRVISNTLITSSRGPEPSKAPQGPPTVFSWPRTLLFPWAVSPTQPRYRLGARSLVHNLPYSSTRILKTKTPGPAFCYLRASG